MEQHLSEKNSVSRGRFIALVILLLAVPCAVILLRTADLLFRSTGIYYWKVFYQRGLPLVIGGSVLCVLLTVWILYGKRDPFRECVRTDRGKLRFTGFLLLIGLLLGIVIWKTRLGLEKENAFYGKPTVPLLEWHLLPAFLICFLWFCASHFTENEAPKLLVRLLPLMIWSTAVIVWIVTPNWNGFFAPAGRAPNFETYPFSDGSFYGHYARAAAAGMGFKGDDIPPRPLYIAFLTGLHLVMGIPYNRIILLQTLVLALFPVFVYLCGRDLHSVEAGLAAAILVILRETHAILSMPFGHNIASTRYFFADIPTALVCSAYVWILIRWQKQTDHARYGRRNAFAAGCILGAMTLIRTQSLFLILLLLFPLTAVFKKSVKRGLVQVLIFLLALGVCVFPWLLRSHRITGQFVFDHPMTQTAEMARSYNFEKRDLSQLPDENDGAYTQRLTAFIAEMTRSHFDIIARFVTVHFLNSEISSFRIFPLRDHFNAETDLLVSSEAFWELLDSGELDPYNLVFYGLGFLIWALGIAASRQRGRHAGLIPLAAILIFNFSTALGRYSAGRYLIPTDWIMILYFAVGMADILAALFRFCGGSVPPAPVPVIGAPPPAETFFFLLLIAAAIPLADRSVPMTFVQDEPAKVMEMTGPLQMECPAEDQYYLHALAVYPRYYAAGEGEPESAKQGYEAADHGRLMFLTMALPHSFGTVEMPLDTPPEYLPDGAEVWFSACQSGPTSIAETLFVRQNGEMIRYDGSH